MLLPFPFNVSKDGRILSPATGKVIGVINEVQTSFSHRQEVILRLDAIIYSLEISSLHESKVIETKKAKKVVLTGSDGNNSVKEIGSLPRASASEVYGHVKIPGGLDEAGSGEHK